MKPGFVRLGIAITILLLSLHIVLNPSYPVSWDFFHHFFAGLSFIRHPLPTDMVEHIPFPQPDPRTTTKLPFGPLVSLPPILSYVLFTLKLNLIPFDQAYNLPIIIVGIAGTLILYLFLLEAFNFPIAISALVMLALYPRYAADIHYNMKDVPQVVAFALAVWMFWRLVNGRRRKDLVLAVVAFAVAFNTKVNTVFMPIVGAVWVGLLIVTKAGKYLRVPLTKVSRKALSPVLGYFLAAPVAAILLWSLFWDNPFDRLLYLPRFFWDNTKNLEVLYFGKWYCSGVNVPWHYPFGYLAIVTPLPILAFFFIGLIKLMRHMRNVPTYQLLLVWLLVPLLRYLLPSIGVIDGIRHFEEVVYPLVAIAAVGFMESITFIKRIAKTRLQKPVLIVGGALLVIWLLVPIIKLHPYQIAYYNELVGGTRGAMGKFDLDYWGISQKEAIMWLNQRVPLGSNIHIVMAADVASKYLRPDLLATVNTTSYDDADYVVVLNRQSFFYRYFYIVEYMLRRKAAFTVSRDGVPLTWVFDNALGKFPRAAEWWHGDSPCIKRYWDTPTP